VIEARLVRALAHAAAGNTDAAQTDLSATLAAAVSVGYVRLFLDEGPAAEELLAAADRRAGSAAYATVLRRAAHAGPGVRTESDVGVDEGLSDRELEVLRLLATELSGPEIARQMYVSLNTLRTHTKHIFTKLGVNTRRAAVRRATELGVL
jgi:ATP/maltotriose-dependent transcriptional regulator MalT